MLWAAAHAAAARAAAITAVFLIEIPPYPSLLYESKIREVGNTVRLGPQPNLPCFVERLVLHLEEPVAVHEYCKQAAVEDDPQRAPLRAGNRVLYATGAGRKSLRRDG